MKPTLFSAIALSIIMGLVGCGKQGATVATNPLPEGDGSRPSPAAPATVQANQAVASALPLTDQRDFEDARRGFIATVDPLIIRDATGKVVWSAEDYRWQNGAPAPDTVNPSLWRQAQLNNIHGLFKVTERIYQVRGFDLASMTIIEGDTGWIIVDPLTAMETAAAALALVNEQLGDRPVTGVLFSHSHIDHFAGAASVVSAEQAASGEVSVVAPLHFVEEAVSENVIAGAVMGRRASLMYGMSLPRDATGHVGTGLGKAPASGSASLIRPNIIISETGQTHTIDGVKFEFQYTPDSEAPSEFMFYLPEFRALCSTELLSRSMHNLYTLRGAKVRDALKWSGYIDEAIVRYGHRTDVIFNSHHWPIFGADTVPDYMKKQRDIYKYIHDQTLRLASQGLTPNEISEAITLPEELHDNFATRGYYGTLKHNAKAIYQYYFGWYDGNPVNLNPLPPVEAGRRYVEAMGGAATVLEKAEAAYVAGDFQWAARLAHHLVFAQPANNAARVMLARSFDQLGYQAESGPWRDVYLSAANELRNGPYAFDIRKNAGALLQEVPPELFLVAMATYINPDKASGRVLTVNLRFTDTGQDFTLLLENAVLNHRTGVAEEADATLSLPKSLFLKIIGGSAGLRDLLGEDGVQVDGSVLKLGQFFASMDVPAFSAFPVVTP